MNLSYATSNGIINFSKKLIMPFIVFFFIRLKNPTSRGQKVKELNQKN